MTLASTALPTISSLDFRKEPSALRIRWMALARFQNRVMVLDVLSFPPVSNGYAVSTALTSLAKRAGSNYGINTVEPVVFRASRSLCACAASRSG